MIQLPSLIRLSARENRVERSVGSSSVTRCRNSVDLSVHGVSLEALDQHKNCACEMGAPVPRVTELADRWAVVFQDNPSVADLVGSVSVGAGWLFNPESVSMSGQNYVREDFEFKVDEQHQEELAARRVVPVPEGWAAATHGLGAVDKDHSNFEKVIG